MQVSLPAPRALLTVGEIAKEIGEPLYRVKYAIDAYRIEPIQRAGIIRLFSREDIPRIKSAITRTASRRGGQNV